MRKTHGQLAYEADVAKHPWYADGRLRKAWQELRESERCSWERNAAVQESVEGEEVSKALR